MAYDAPLTVAVTNVQLALDARPGAGRQWRESDA